MATSYKKNSPYAGTAIYGKFLDVLEYRKISKQPDDVTYKINSVYKYRPDMLAYDLYGNSQLWWVFYQRNPNTLQTAPVDFSIGTQIYIPQINNLKTTLGF